MSKKKKNEYIAAGRRKTAVASILIREGTGKFDVNGRDLNKYFLSDIQRNIVLSPLKNNLEVKNYDFIIRLKGGGIEAQAVAARLGISRALVKKDETLKGPLKDLGYLTRDPRKKERKKYGLAGARKRFQFSKR